MSDKQSHQQQTAGGGSGWDSWHDSSEEIALDAETEEDEGAGGEGDEDREDLLLQRPLRTERMVNMEPRQPIMSNFRHPLAVIFHLLFRVSSLVAYLLCSFVSSSFVTSFVVILLLLSMDFWTVKNVTGRLMVGLRWWNRVDEDGNSHWVFESRKKTPKSRHQFESTAAESRLFWLALVGTEIIWSFLLVAALFSLKLAWVIVVCVALFLNGANLYGYIRCKLGAKKPLGSAAKEFLGQQVWKSMLFSAQQTVIQQNTENVSREDTNRTGASDSQQQPQLNSTPTKGRGRSPQPPSASMPKSEV